MLTAWHCVSTIGGGSARIWLRLQPRDPGEEPIDVPARCVAYRPALDAALLTFDAEREADLDDRWNTAELLSYLGEIALPLATDVEPHDEVRVVGHPERNPAAYSVSFVGVVDTSTAMLTRRRVIRATFANFGASSPESPQGMSGGPLLRLRRADHTEAVVGWASAFPRGVNAVANDALGAVVLFSHIADLRSDFPEIREALRRSPTAAIRHDGQTSGTEYELAPDATMRCLRTLQAAGLVPPRWTYAAIRDVIEKRLTPTAVRSRAEDILRFIAEAARAKAVFAAVNGREVELGRLNTLYRQEIGAWPTSGSADSLLVQAADADLRERRDRGWPSLSPLARFLVTVASDTGVRLDDSAELSGWLTDRGHQLGDARRHQETRGQGGWLLLDLGDEPGPADPPYPARVTWSLMNGTEVIGRHVDAAGTRDGLLRALRTIFRDLPPTHPLIVDLAVPFNLLTEGIEHWPLREVDGEFEPISADGRPRLRWSRRRRDATLHGRLVDRVSRARWERLPDPLGEEMLRDTTRLARWARAEDNPAWLLGGLSAIRSGQPLRALLRAGYGFMVWLPGGDGPDGHLAIRKAAKGIPAVARRDQIPDALPELPDVPLVIWDDPRGRSGFELPPMIEAESCQV